MRKAILVISFLLAISSLFAAPSNTASRMHSQPVGLAQKAIPALAPSDAMPSNSKDSDELGKLAHSEVSTPPSEAIDGQHGSAHLQPIETSPEGDFTIPLLALVFGCLSLISVLLGPIVALPLSIAGIILGAMGMGKKYKERKLAIAGFILSILAFLASAFFITILILWMTI